MNTEKIREALRSYALTYKKITQESSEKLQILQELIKRIIFKVSFIQGRGLSAIENDIKEIIDQITIIIKTLQCQNNLTAITETKFQNFKEFYSQFEEDIENLLQELSQSVSKENVQKKAIEIQNSLNNHNQLIEIQSEIHQIEEALDELEVQSQALRYQIIDKEIDKSDLQQRLHEKQRVQKQLTQSIEELTLKVKELKTEKITLMNELQQKQVELSDLKEKQKQNDILLPPSNRIKQQQTSNHLSLSVMLNLSSQTYQEFFLTNKGGQINWFKKPNELAQNIVDLTHWLQMLQTRQYFRGNISFYYLNDEFFTQLIKQKTLITLPNMQSTQNYCLTSQALKQALEDNINHGLDGNRVIVFLLHSQIEDKDFMQTQHILCSPTTKEQKLTVIGINFAQDEKTFKILDEQLKALIEIGNQIQGIIKSENGHEINLLYSWKSETHIIQVFNALRNRRSVQQSQWVVVDSNEGLLQKEDSQKKIIEKQELMIHCLEDIKKKIQDIDENIDFKQNFAKAVTDQQTDYNQEVGSLKDQLKNIDNSTQETEQNISQVEQKIVSLKEKKIKCLEELQNKQKKSEEQERLLEALTYLIQEDNDVIKEISRNVETIKQQIAPLNSYIESIYQSQQEFNPNEDYLKIINFNKEFQERIKQYQQDLKNIYLNIHVFNSLSASQCL